MKGCTVTDDFENRRKRGHFLYRTDVLLKLAGTAVRELDGN